MRPIKGSATHIFLQHTGGTIGQQQNCLSKVNLKTHGFPVSLWKNIALRYQRNSLARRSLALPRCCGFCYYFEYHSFARLAQSHIGDRNRRNTVVFIDDPRTFYLNSCIDTYSLYCMCATGIAVAISLFITCRVRAHAILNHASNECNFHDQLFNSNVWGFHKSSVKRFAELHMICLQSFIWHTICHTSYIHKSTVLKI